MSKRSDLQRKNADRLGDVLELGLAEIAHRKVEPRLHLAIGVFGKTDRAGSSDTFEPRGDIDAVAHQVAVALFDHIADMNADAKLDAPIVRNASVPLDHGVLDFQGTPHGVDHAAEF